MVKCADILTFMRRCLALALVACVCLGSFAQSDDYNRLSTKAARFFDNHEWLNANAMYLLMLDQHPLEVSTYSHAIVSNIMAGDTISMGNLLEQSMQNNVPFDSLLNSVQHVSLQLGSSDLYERVLLTSRQRFSWLSRGINAYLLKYYDFRNNAPEIIRYAKIMLAGMPDDITFQRQLARGYMLNNQPEYAVEVWFNIIEKNPEHYDTLIDIASYFEDTGEHSRAITYWQRAYKIRQTPYVKAMLN